MKVLAFAPHPDDEIIGIGGTLAKRAEEGNEVYVCIVTSGQPPIYTDEATAIVQSEARNADNYIGVKETIFLNFPAVMLETVPRYQFNGKINDIIQRIAPDEVYIPHRGDMQIDHQMVVDACMVGLRPRGEKIPKRIYAYETLSETGWNIPTVCNEFIPNVFEDITNFLDKKINAMKLYTTQLMDYPNTRSIEAMEALAKYRGSTVSVKAAEAFMLIREIKR